MGTSRRAVGGTTDDGYPGGAQADSDIASDLPGYRPVGQKLNNTDCDLSSQYVLMCEH